MDTEFTDEQLAFQQSVRALARAELPAYATRAEERHGRDREVFTWAARHHLLGLNFPEEYGGAGADKVVSIIAAEELAYADAGLSGMLAGQSGVATEAIYRHGTDEQRKELLPRVFAGELVIGIAITEPDAGSNIAGTKTVATPDGDGYRLNGAKTFISYAGIADYIVVIARMPGTTGREGLTAFLVSTDQPGYQLAPPIRKLGQESSDTGEFVLVDAWAPQHAVIGEPGRAFTYVQETLTSGRIDYGARTVGVAQACFDEALSYAGNRAPFGRPILSYQATQFKLARMAMQIEAARALAYKAARAYDREPDSPATELYASICKLNSSEAARDVSWEALQIHGAYGYTAEFRISRLFRDARLFTLSEGTSEVQLMNIARLVGARA